MRVDEWVQLRTFSYRQFADPWILTKKKHLQKTKISLCFPTLNEAQTIGKIIKVIKGQLQDKIPLIDEIFVMDSGSTDGTQEIAARKGVRVFQSAEVLPESGNIRGKGENLWKSLHVSNGDIILWLDSDIRNMNIHFVLGLLGPLVYHRDISFVKGFYRRPIKIGSKMASTGGGRVTEILVKPAFNLLFPRLAAFSQPLSGEYAGRRELLERIPFFTGYGVETAMLIDIENRFGLSCMAQTDLDVRVHRNQDLNALRKMAYGILRVILTRAEQHGKLILMDSTEGALVSVLKDEFERYCLHLDEFNEIERSPIILNEEYQEKRALREEDLVLLEEILKKRSYPFLSVSGLMDKRLMALEGEAASKDEVLKEVASMLVTTHIASDYPQVVFEFFKREQTMSTGIGSGVAIPHIISSLIKQLKIVVYRSRSGITFDSLDGLSVNLLFAVVGPPQRQRLYLNVLANLAQILKDEHSRNLLLAAENQEEFLNIFRKMEIMKRFKRELELIES